jgi:hypothetical protein
MAANAKSDPLSVLASVAEHARDDCPDLDHFNTFSGDVNNYAAGAALLVCRSDPHGAGARIDAVKAIQGNDRWYIVHRSRAVARIGAPEANGEDGIAQLHAELAEVVSVLSLYVRSVTLCDDERAEHPCAPSDPAGG